MDRTPLDTTKLSPAAQKALGPGPGRMMAARGLMPLSPADQATVLYQLALDAEFGTAATATAKGLPEKVIAGALTDGALDPRVIDFFGELILDKPAAFEAVVQNPATADTTIAKLAGKAAAGQVDRIAANEQRLLRHPEIIAAMYLNKHARMSTVDRAVELAVRNSVRVPNLAAWDEIARALEHSPGPSDDSLFADAIAETDAEDDSLLTKGDVNAEDDPDRPSAATEAARKKKQRYDKMPIQMKIRLAMTGNAYDRAKAIHDPVRIVALAAIKSPAVTEFEAKSYAGNQSISEDVIRHIAGRREWTKNIQVKKALCRNPKTPINDVAKLLPFLLERDLNNLARSKGVPSAVAAQAKKLLSQRKGGSKH